MVGDDGLEPPTSSV